MMYDFGNAQLIGEREHQSNYFSVLSSGGSMLAVLADGHTDSKSGKYAAVLAVEVFKHEYRSGVFRETGMRRFFSRTFKKIEKNIKGNIYNSDIAAATAAVIIDNGFLHFAAACGKMYGNSLLLYRQRNLVELSGKDAGSGIQISRFKLKKDDIIMLASKGAVRSLTEIEIISHISKQMHPYDKCQCLAGIIRQKKLKSQFNATMIILENLI